MNLSFGGCGFLGVYHIGVATCLRKHAPHLLKELSAIAGASSGSLVAAVLATGGPIEESLDFAFHTATAVRKHLLGPLTPGFDLNKYLEAGIKKYLPSGSHSLASGKLHISVTSYPQGKNMIISEFKSDEELVQVLLGSCFIPGYAGLQFPSFNGQKLFDGGFSNNLPILPQGRTITVSPFSGDCDITPEDKSTYTIKGLKFRSMQIDLNAENIQRGYQALNPPRRGKLREIYNNGFNDALTFLESEGLIS